MENRTVLIGIDGATFTILDMLMEKEVMPSLKQFIASGVRSKLLSTTPPITNPAWTSMLTGQSPGNHGIFDFFRFESPNSRYVRFLNSRNIACETIWSITSRQGLRVTSLNFPVMMPLRPINGFIVPGWTPPRHIRRGCYPKGLYEKLNEHAGVNVRDLAIDPVMERVALAGCSEEEYQGWIEHHIQKELKWFKVLRYLMKKEPCHFTAILFDGGDKLQHLCWRFIYPELFPETPSPWERKIQNLCLDYFRQLDNFIADIVELAGPDANILMASDHGFGTSTEVFYVNTWLHQNGYLEWADTDDIPVDDGSGEQDPRVVLPRNYVRTLDWNKTTAHGLTASSNAIHISVAGQRGPEGIPPQCYEHFRQELIESLLKFTDSEGKPVITNVWTREELFSGSQMNLAPDLTVGLRDNGFVSTLRSDVPFKQRPEPIGTHYPDGIFMAIGPGIRKGISLSKELSIMDVTPTLLYMLGLSVPEDLEGRTPEEIFEPDWIESHPIQIGEPTLPPQVDEQRGEPEEMDAEGKAKILARLKALGYVD